MKFILFSLLAGLAVAGVSAPAIAADPYGGPPPPEAPYVPAPVVGDGWYLRGDIGIGISVIDKWEHPDTTFEQESAGDAGIFGIGLGYQFNDWIRADITGEFRSSFTTVARERVDCCTYLNWDGQVSAFAGFANLYADLGTYAGVTPFVGIGAGFAYVMTDGWRADGHALNDGSTNFAWAVHAGLSYAVTPSFKVDLAYRYTDLGDVTTGDIICPSCGAGSPPIQPIKTSLTSHDLRLGVRWLFAAEPVYDKPIVAKY